MQTHFKIGHEMAHKIPLNELTHCEYASSYGSAHFIVLSLSLPYMPTTSNIQLTDNNNNLQEMRNEYKANHIFYMSHSS